MRLNVGAGSDVRAKSEGWVNCDIRPLSGIDIVCDARHLPFEGGSFEEILAFDLLEHLSLFDAPVALRDWWRVLRSGGLLRLRVPDVRKIAFRILDRSLQPDPDKVQKPNPNVGTPTGEDAAIWLMFGDQSSEWGGTEFGSHRWGYTSDTLRRLLVEKGFEVDDIHGDPQGKDQNLYASARKE